MEHRCSICAPLPKGKRARPSIDHEHVAYWLSSLRLTLRLHEKIRQQTAFDNSLI